jgi:hypothetical protein
MIATSRNSRGECERCRKVKPFVLASAFQGDGNATFRHLCAQCERVEKPQNQPGLFGAVTHGSAEEAIEDLTEPKAVDDRQMGLFTNADLQRY